MCGPPFCVSQWTKILDLLEVMLENLGIPFLRLDGQTPIPERQALIDRSGLGRGRKRLIRLEAEEWC